MKIIVHSSYNARSIAGSLGKAEYSYYFVMAGFLPALRQLGTVVEIDDPEREADAIFDACQRTNEACVLLLLRPALPGSHHIALPYHPGHCLGIYNNSL